MKLLFWILFVIPYLQKSSGQITQKCLDCICQASTGCDLSKKCHNAGGNAYYCGPYQISWAYWSDGGKPGLNDRAHDFELCLNDKKCAEQAVMGYMRKWETDCNGDGVIDCEDYAAIHKAGAANCNAEWLKNTDYWKTFQDLQCFDSSPVRGTSSGAHFSNSGFTTGRAPAQPLNWIPRTNNQSSVLPLNRNAFDFSNQPVIRTLIDSSGRTRVITNPSSFNTGLPPESSHRTSFATNTRTNNNFPSLPAQPIIHRPATNFITNFRSSQPANTNPIIPNQPIVSHGIPLNRETPSISSVSSITELVNKPETSVSTIETVEQSCLECICIASSNCDIKKRCSGSYCGPYLLSWAYWADGGKPGTDYVTCSLDKSCAESAVQGYMTKWKKDCNNDGVIDCDDFAVIHKLGPHACGSSVLSSGKYWNSYKQCSNPSIDARSQSH